MDMIKENKEFFLYILGAMVSVIVLVIVFDYFVVGSSQGEGCGFLGAKCWLNNITTGEMQYSEPPEMFIDKDKDYRAIIKTNQGDIEVDLFEKNAPMTVNNFVFLSNEGYYDGVEFHRISKGKLIQTGDRNTLDSDETNDGEGGPGYTFDDEIYWESLDLSEAKKQRLKDKGYSSDSDVTSRKLENRSLAMANSGPDTNGSQFFIVTASSDSSSVKGLEGMHTVFGRVSTGWDVVEEIESVEVDDPSSNSPSPVEEVKILTIEIKED